MFYEIFNFPFFKGHRQPSVVQDAVLVDLDAWGKEIRVERHAQRPKYRVLRHTRVDCDRTLLRRHIDGQRLLLDGRLASYEQHCQEGY